MIWYDDVVGLLVAVRRLHLLIDAAQILQEAKQVAAQGLQSATIFLQNSQQEGFAHSLEELPSLEFWRMQKDEDEREKTKKIK